MQSLVPCFFASSKGQWHQLVWLLNVLLCGMCIFLVENWGSRFLLLLFLMRNENLFSHELQDLFRFSSLRLSSSLVLWMFKYSKFYEGILHILTHNNSGGLQTYLCETYQVFFLWDYPLHLCVINVWRANCTREYYNFAYIEIVGVYKPILLHIVHNPIRLALCIPQNLLRFSSIVLRKKRPKATTWT